MGGFAATTRWPQPMMQGRTVRGLRADGSEVPVEVSISHTITGGERLFTAVLRDVTARDAAQQALSASLLALNGGPQWVLQVSDTGVGLPPDFEARRQGSLGLQLIHDLSRQVKGALMTGATPEGGALFCVTFTPDKTMPLAVAMEPSPTGG